ncbi:MAG: hypothetical protein HFH81_09180 [Lachnospiraceae bacterium]|nr:hypothetical protein [Lachnospiraceae bacterium]
MKYYLIKTERIKKVNFVIWYTGDDDGFLLLDDRLLVFSNEEEANAFAQEKSIFFEKGVVIFDFTDILELIFNIESSKNCRILINAWNFFSDLSRSVNVKFIGDKNEDIILDIYNKIIYGCNLEILKNDKFCPEFNDKETDICLEIFQSGLSMLDQQLDDTALRR